MKENLKKLGVAAMALTASGCDIQLCVGVASFKGEAAASCMVREENERPMQGAKPDAAAE